MIRWQTLLGAVIGVFVGATFLNIAGTEARRRAASGPILSECDGHLRELVIQYEPGSKSVVAATYRDFLSALEADVTVHVVCPDRAAFADLLATIGPVKCRLEPIVVSHPMTTWARDRWVALAPADRGGATTVWSPQGEAGADLWPARAGDERMGSDIAAALAPGVKARRALIYFDGGDFLTDESNVFVMPRVLQRNIQHSVFNRDQLIAILNRQLDRHVILLDRAPDHHAGMYMASIGNHTMLVGDPRLGRDFVPADACETNPTNGFMHLPGGPDFSAQTQEDIDAVARESAAAGYKVVRMPTIPAHDGKTYLTYVNVIMDEQRDRRIVYLPYYRGVEEMNAAARAIWQSEGYEVRPVDCTDTYTNFGCLHCLVNVLKRG